VFAPEQDALPGWAVWFDGPQNGAKVPFVGAGGSVTYRRVVLALAFATAGASVPATTASAADVGLAGAAPVVAPASATTGAVTAAAGAATDLAARATTRAPNADATTRKLRGSVAATTSRTTRPQPPSPSPPARPAMRSTVSRATIAVASTAVAAASAARATSASAAAAARATSAPAASAARATSAAAGSAARATPAAAASAVDLALRTADSTLRTATGTVDPLIGVATGLAGMAAGAGLQAVDAAEGMPGVRVATTTQPKSLAAPASSFAPWPLRRGPLALGRPANTRTAPQGSHVPATALVLSAPAPAIHAAGTDPTLPTPAPPRSGATTAGAIGPGSAGATAALLLALFALVAPAIRRRLVAPSAHRWPAAPVFLLDRPG
jgi:hypothetical protein